MRLTRRFRPVNMNGCVLYLPFYAYGANAQKIWDMSGQGDHGTITGAVLAPYGWSFDGIDDEVLCSLTDSLSLSSITFLSWFKRTSADFTNPFKIFVGNIDSVETYFGMVGAPPYLSLNISGTQRTVSASINTTLNKWHCGVATWSSGNSLKLYLDGSLAGDSTTTYEGSLSNLTKGFVVGTSGDRGGPFLGVISELLVFSRSFSLSEIKSYYELTRYRYGT